MADDDEEVLDDENEPAEGQDAEGQDGDEQDDAAPEDAEQSGEEPGQDDGAPGAEPERQVSRGGQRFQRLANDNAGLRQELEQLRRSREQEAQRAAQQQQQWDEQAWNDRLAVMTPEEQARAMWQRGQWELQQQQQRTNQQLFLMRDQLAFEAKATVNPVYARYQNEVERVFVERMQQGRGLAREDILRNILGERALSTANRSTTKARKQGQRRIEAQTTRPSNSRGDASSTRGKQGDSAEKRLAGIEI